MFLLNKGVLFRILSARPRKFFSLVVERHTYQQLFDSPADSQFRSNYNNCLNHLNHTLESANASRLPLQRFTNPVNFHVQLHALPNNEVAQIGLTNRRTLGGTDSMLPSMSTNSDFSVIILKWMKFKSWNCLSQYQWRMDGQRQRQQQQQRWRKSSLNMPRIQCSRKTVVDNTFFSDRKEWWRGSTAADETASRFPHNIWNISGEFKDESMNFHMTKSWNALWLA